MYSDVTGVGYIGVLVHKIYYYNGSWKKMEVVSLSFHCLKANLHNFVADKVLMVSQQNYVQ